ncbi:MAG: ribosome recycling factor [Candidatus Brocadiae bacterium]|nr:ribosome recycling factor [Candidatus Brocadiia bacterium]
MDVDDVLLDAEERMEKAVQVFADAARGIRTGSASAGLVESIRVDYYGSLTPLKQLAQIAVPDPQLIVVKPYDPASLENVEKAIQASDIGINPQSDGRVIRLSIPSLSQERREQLAGRVKGMAEEARIAVRNIRRDANRHLDKERKASSIGEDDCRRAKDDVQELTDQYEGQIDETLQKKTDEIVNI